MELRDRHGLKEAARTALNQSGSDHRKLVLIHTAATAIVLLALTGINFLLQNQIEDTGGLSGLGTRAILSTIQSILQSAGSLALPFWEFGYLFMILYLIRGESVSVKTFLSGFRHFGPIIRFLLLKGLLFSLIGMLCFYPSMMIFMMTPLAQPALKILEPLAAEGMVSASGEILLDEATMTAVTEATAPVIVIFLILYLLLCIPVFYRLRMGEYSLVQNPKAGAIAALRQSSRMMKGNGFALFRLDISFWWYYALEVIISVICYGDVLLPILGIQLPFSANTAFFLFYVLNLLGQIALYTWKRNEIMGTYAAAFLSMQEVPTTSQPIMPEHRPWDYE